CDSDHSRARETARTVAEIRGLLLLRVVVCANSRVSPALALAGLALPLSLAGRRLSGDARLFHRDAGGLRPAAPGHRPNLLRGGHWIDLLLVALLLDGCRRSEG